MFTVVQFVAGGIAAGVRTGDYSCRTRRIVSADLHLDGNDQLVRNWPLPSHRQLYTHTHAHTWCFIFWRRRNTAQSTSPSAPGYI